MMFTQDVIKQSALIKNYLSNLWVELDPLIWHDNMLTAFVHKSYAADYTQKLAHNERLEFLWDAILWAIIARQLYIDFPHLEESKLTLYKIALVREETLATVARDIALSHMIFLGNGEWKTWWRDKDAILADSLEAVIGFIYLDLGYEKALNFVLRYIYPKVQKLSSLTIKSSKSILQELVQKNHKQLPHYKDFDFEIDDKGNTTSYKSEVYIMTNKVGEWFGQNKKKAQEEAAKNALSQVNLV